MPDPSKKIRSLFLLVLACLACSEPLSAQWLEQYMSKKETEKSKPNPYLTGSSSQSTDIIQDYYRQLMRGQQGKTDATGAAAQQAQLASSGLKTVLEGAIDPNAYLVGPGDVFAISVGSSLEALPIPVSPEGNIVIPTVGSIAVAGKTLAAAKTAVASAIAGKYRGAEAPVSLLSLRVFRVHVVGMTALPGPCYVSAVDRVDRAVALSGSLSMAPSQQQDTLPFPQRNLRAAGAGQQTRYVSLRNILVQRKSGQQVNADLVRYYASGNVRFNPVLADGDIILLRPESTSGNSVGVYGAVAMEGTFEYRSDDSLLAAIDIAGGIAPDADVRKVELVRSSESGEQTSQTIDLQAIRDGSAPNIPLQVNDRVYVHAKAREVRTRQASVYGEVRLPGRFPMPPKGMLLSALIARAGGFTPRASLPAARVIRRAKSADPAERSPDFVLMEQLRLSSLSTNGRDYFTYESALGQNLVSVDFTSLFERSTPSADILLEDGDVVYIPERETNIAVLGQVNRPGYLPFAAGSDVEDYLRRAGGVAESGDASELMVIKYGTSQWVEPGETALEPGDKIWVPQKKVREFEYYFALIRDFFAVAATIATTVLLYYSTQK